MASTSPNQVQVNGRGNIVIQDVHNSTITINPRDPDFEQKLKALIEKGLALSEAEIPRLKEEAEAQRKQYQRRLLLLVLLLIGTGVAAGWLYADRLQQPFNYTLTVVDETGTPSTALTGELDKLILPPGDTLLTDTVEKSQFSLTQSASPIVGDIRGSKIFLYDVPASYRGEPLSYDLTSRFYQVQGQPATLTLTGDSRTLVIERNETLCCVRGFVGARDRGNAALAGAKVFLASQEATSDANGNFELQIPKDQQQRQVQIRISHPGYQDLRRTVLPELTPSQTSPTPFLLTPISS